MTTLLEPNLLTYPKPPIKSISQSLLSEQKQSTRTPKVKLELHNCLVGAKRLSWEQIYSGSYLWQPYDPQADKPHDMAIAGDGSITRVRSVSEGVQKRLRWQRIENPGPSSDWGDWPNYFSARENYYCAVCALGSEVLIFHNHYRYNQVFVRRSIDYGASYDGGTYLGAGYFQLGASAAFKPNGDVCLAWLETYSSYVLLKVIRRINGVWQAATTAPATHRFVRVSEDPYGAAGVALYYDFGWNMLICGKWYDSIYTCKKRCLYQTTLSDDGTWGDLIEVISVPDGEDVGLQNPFIDKPDTPLFFVVEEFTGSEAYQRPMYSALPQGNAFRDAVWREPVPFNFNCEYGLSICHDDNYAWLEMPTRVYRASLASSPLDVSGDVRELNQVVRDGEGKLTVELDNHAGDYTNHEDITPGTEARLSVGYITSEGEEYSEAGRYWLEGAEYRRAPNLSTLTLSCIDIWGLARLWTARYQMRWNMGGGTISVWKILKVILARLGIPLELYTASTIVLGYAPDFTISPGDRGDRVIKRLLSFVPDKLLFDGITAYIINPGAEEASRYSYGEGKHAITGISRSYDAPDANRAQVVGKNQLGLVIADSFNWQEIALLGDRLRLEADLNIDTVSKAKARGKVMLEDALRASRQVRITTPPNCAILLWDVVDVSDEVLGLDGEKYRVEAIELTRDDRGVYQHQLTLGGV